MRVRLKRSAWEFPPSIDPSTYGFDYDSYYLVEYTKKKNSIKSIKIISHGLYDASYFEEVSGD